MSRQRLCQRLTWANLERHFKYMLNKPFDLRIISGRNAALAEVLVFARRSATFPSYTGGSNRGGALL
jgi:hypothetical protein